MLLQLHIENVAVIDEVDVHFKEGLNILTGETGAGKSIIIDSINMVLGERTSRDLIRSGEEKAVVEALFQVDSEVVVQQLREFGLDVEEDNTLLISRQMTAGGRNVCRVNGNIVTSTILKEISKYIVNIHGQHDNQALLEWENHVEFLDKYAGESLLKLREQYRQVFDERNRIQSEIKRISRDEREKERRLDLLKFQMEEIDKAKLVRGEEEELENQRLILGNAGKLMSATTNAYERLYGGNQVRVSIHDSLANVLQELGEVKQFDSRLEKYYTTLEEISFQLDELVHDIRDYRDHIEFDPDALEQIEQRIDLIYKLKRKYGGSIEEILEYRDKVSQEMEDITSGEEKLNALQAQLEENNEKLTQLAEDLFSLRVEAAQSLQQKIMKELQDLNMEKTTFKVQVEKEYDSSGHYKFSQQGMDRIEFLISTNPGEPLKPLVKIASGGEMSRIMLAIKTVLADTDVVNTLIFDEIDMGVSGRAAQKIAEKLYLIGRKKQVLCITHLPQLASMADYHYLIEKNIVGGKSHTTVQQLSDQHRKKELARIIGGAVMTDLTLKHAEEMISIADEIKKAANI